MSRKMLPGETLSQFAIRTAFDAGHFWNPENPDCWNVTRGDLSKLHISDPRVLSALRSLTRSMAGEYSRHVFEQHDRPPQFDGVMGAATESFLIREIPKRCPVPDFVPPPGVDHTFADPYVADVVQRMQERNQLPATGSGSWRNCHGVGSYHCAKVMFNLADQPEHLKPVFTEVLGNVQRAYAAIGLLLLFVDVTGRDMITGEERGTGGINIHASFVQRSDGWIGLAIVGRNETCSSQPIWMRFLATFHRNAPRESIVVDWSSLLRHEIGHLTGSLHTVGGTMNSVLVPGLPLLFPKTDPVYPYLVQEFGGQPVPLDDSDDGGPTPPEDPDPLAAQVRENHIVNAVQEAHLEWLTKRQRTLESTTNRLAAELEGIRRRLPA